MENQGIPLYPESSACKSKPSTPVGTFFTDVKSISLVQNSDALVRQSQNDECSASLDLSHKNLAVIPTSALEYSDSITTLYLSWNPGIYLESSLGKFSNVLNLHLAHCALECLPHEISNLKKLQIMDLSGNYDLLPSSFLAQVRQLNELRIEDCNLKMLPAELQDLDNMEALDISHNAAVQVLSAEVLPINLKFLRAVNCGLTMLRSIERLRKVEELDVSKNENLTSLPSEIGLMASLKKLYVNYCCLGGFPKEIGQLMQLEELEARGNKTLLYLPQTIAGLHSLKKLTIAECNLSMLPTEISGLTALEVLNICDNSQLRELPATIGNLCKLRKLLVARCAVRFIPAELTKLADLEQLLISGNSELLSLQPTLPGLRSLRKLDISRCSLTSLPDCLGNLHTLEELQLEGNSNLEILNPAMTHMRRLRKLDISLCSLTSIPDWLGDLQQLKELLLVGNTQLRALNSAIGRLSRLAKLDISWCSISSVPEWLGNLQSLEQLILFGNKKLQINDLKLGRLLRLKKLDISSCLIASIPDDFGEIATLEKLLLVGNTKLRNLNPELSSLRQLVSLDVSHCSLTTIPDCFKNLQTLEELMLAGNAGLQLNPALSHLYRLVKLDISQCSLTSVPSWLGDLKMLEELLLVGNTQLVQLDAALCRLRRLKKLDASMCSLTSIPDKFGEHNVLTQLRLSDNQFQRYPHCTLRLKSLLLLDLSNRARPLIFADELGNIAGNETSTGNCIKFLPVDLAFTNLRTLTLEGNPVIEPVEEVWRQGIDAIKFFMRAIIPRGKLMCEDTINIIGDMGAGKTSVAQSLINGFPQCAREEDRTCVLQQLQLRIHENAGWSVTVNDFGGHNTYHCVMPIFLPTNGLVIIVYNMSDDIESQEIAVKKWLLTVLAKSNNIRVIIAGTRSDKLSNEKRKSLEQHVKSFSLQVLQKAIDEVKQYENRCKSALRDADLEQKLANTRYVLEKLEKAIIYVVTLSCKAQDQGLLDLRNQVLLMLRPPKRLSLQWCRVISGIFEANPECLYLTMDYVKAIFKSHLPNADCSEDLRVVLRYLVSASQIIWLEDHPQLAICIFHCPQRLIELCRRALSGNRAFLHAAELTQLLGLDTKQYKRSISQECSAVGLLNAGDENSVVETVILQHFNLISLIVSDFHGRTFFIPSNLSIEAPSKLQCFQQEVSKSFNGVNLRLSFCGMTIPTAFFETSIASILNVLNELHEECVVAAACPDGLIVFQGGVQFSAIRREGMIELEAFTSHIKRSPWSILNPVVRRLSNNVAAYWHGLQPGCAILCPVCRRHCLNDNCNSEICFIDTTLQSLTAEVAHKGIKIICPQFVVALPKCLCYPTKSDLLTVEQQQEVDKFLKELVLRPPLTFEPAAVTTKLSIACCDVSVTEDGRILLAADANGLLEYDAMGTMLSTWKPPTRPMSEEHNLVSAVEVLSDGRVAVGLWHGEILLLIRVCSDREPWTLEKTLEKVPRSLRDLAANGDLLAVALRFKSGLQLVSLSSGQLLDAKEREYEIRSVTVTAEKIVTLSCEGVILPGNTKAFVVDAHSRDDDRRLWRYAVGNKEEARDVCADKSGRLLYLAVWYRDGNVRRGRVAFICAENGCELRTGVISIGETLVPVKLSLGKVEKRAALALLGGGPVDEQRGKTVVVYSMIGDEY